MIGNIEDVSISSVGVQIVTEVGDWAVPGSHERGSPIWDFLWLTARKQFADRPEVRGKELVRVDIKGAPRAQAQWSFK